MLKTIPIAMSIYDNTYNFLLFILLTMQTYSVWALIKFIIWLIIVAILYKYVNVYESPILWLSFWFLGIFMIIWGMMYFFFLGLYKLWSSDTSHNKQTSLSYKLSLLFSLCMMINITLMINNQRSNILWLASLWGFLFLIPVFAIDKNLNA